MGIERLPKPIKNAVTQIGFVKKMRARKGLRKLVFDFKLPESKVQLVEKDPGQMQTVLAGHIEQWKDKAAEIGNTIDAIFVRRPDLTANGAEQLRQDMLFCYFAYGFTPHEYLCYGLDRKKPDERRTFVSDRESIWYAYRMNDFYAKGVFMDKMKTYFRFQPYFKREAVCVCGESDEREFQRFVSKHPVFVKKDVFESCGRGIELIDLTDRALGTDSFFRSLMNGGKYILEERVEQSNVMAALNRSSVNTVRCLTVNTRHGILTPWCFLKVGREGSFVDNGGAGGILVGIDVESGKLATAGIDELALRYEAHPDTGIEFVGYQLPDWEDMLSMCREMAAMEPKNKWIGWDLAHTDRGWVVIEGNAMSEVIGPQATGQRGIRQELDRCMSDMDLVAL